MSGMALSSGALAALALPPYWMRRPVAASAPTSLATHARIAACVSCACRGERVPMCERGVVRCGSIKVFEGCCCHATILSRHIKTILPRCLNKHAVPLPTCAGDAVTPVPMAHTGSYASTTFDGVQRKQGTR